MKRILFVAACVVLVAGFLLASWMFREHRVESLDFLAQERAELFVRPHSPTRGAEDARVHLVEFTDPACETCAAFAPYLERFLAEHPGRVRLVVRYAPFHEGADDVVRVLEAARMQGKFWETLHLLYRSQRSWTRHHRVHFEQVRSILAMTDLDLERLRQDMADPRITEVIRQDLADAEALGVNKTPGFFVNGTPLEPFGLEPLASLIEAEVARQYPD